MKKYKIDWSAVIYGSTIVKAKDEEEARQLIENVDEFGDLNYTSDVLLADILDIKNVETDDTEELNNE